MTIREVEQQLGITRANVRFYEKEGLIWPKRNPLNDYRDYSEADVDSLKKIIFLRELDVPISEIRDLIRGTVGLNDVVRRRMEVLDAELVRTGEARRACELLLEQKNLTYAELTVPKIPSGAPQKSLRDTLGDLWMFWDKLVVWGFFLLQAAYTVFVFPMLPDQIPVSWQGGIPTDYKSRIYFFGYLLLSVLVLYGARIVLYQWVVGAARCYMDELNAVLTVGGIGFCFSTQVYTVMYLKGIQMSQDWFYIGCIGAYLAVIAVVAALMVQRRRRIR